MKPFFWLLIICSALAGTVPAQGAAAIEFGDAGVTASRSKWEKGVLNNLTPPTGFDSWPDLRGSGDPFRNVIQGYYYQADFTNQSGLKIKGIIWEYVFLDPATKKELGRHKIFSKTSIKKGKTDTVTAFRIKPPSGTISAEALGEKDRKKQYAERIEIKAVLFSDGTLWKAPGISERDGNRLRMTVKRGRIFRY